MKSNINKVSILLFIFMLFQVIFNVVSYAESDGLVSIEFQDTNMYNAVLTKLEEKYSILEKNDVAKNFKIAKSDINNVRILYLDEANITNISGIEIFNNLQHLSLDKNKINNIEPLRNLSNLISLSLSSNQINNIEPLQNLSNLQTLNLSSNQISNIESLQNLSNLIDLNLNSNQISNVETLGNLSNLQFLKLGLNKISNIEPLTNLSNLKDLGLISNKINNIEPLQNLSNLQNLYLNDNQLNDINPLQNLSNLETLYLNNNKINDIRPLQNLLKLQKLELAKNLISNIEPLQNLSNLTHLTLNDNNISDIEITNKYNNTIRFSCLRQILNFETKSNIVDLPKIFIQAKNNTSLGFTEKDFLLVNCTLNDARTQINILDNSKDASIRIIGGTLQGSMFTVKSSSEAPENPETPSDNKTQNNTDEPNKVVNVVNPEDNSVANTPIPKTGESLIIFIAISILLFFAIIVRKLYNNNRDI